MTRVPLITVPFTNVVRFTHDLTQVTRVTQATRAGIRVTRIQAVILIPLTHIRAVILRIQFLKPLINFEPKRAFQRWSALFLNKMSGM